MKKPTLEEVEIFATSLGKSLEFAQKFFYHYEMNGWKVGKNAMKSWKAGIHYWIRTEKTKSNGNKFSEESIRDRLSRW